MAGVTHRIKVMECGRGFFSLCKSALQGVIDAHRENRDAKCTIEIRDGLYAPGKELHRTFFIPTHDGEGGDSYRHRGHNDCGNVRDMRHWMRQDNHHLAVQYFQPIKALADRIETVVAGLGANPLGVHFRGCDKGKECRVYSLDTYKRQLSNVVRSMKPSAVFLATDETRAVRELSSVAPIVALDHLRADDAEPVGIHHRKLDGLRLGGEAVIDAYVLARCSMMLSGVSNVSDWAAILSPDMPWVRLV